MQKQVLILSGPTHEYFDPVRFIGNASSGKMGKALAEEAVQRGFAVEFVTGPVAESHLPNIERKHIHGVLSAEEMLARAGEFFPISQICVFAAAIADYTPVEKNSEKLPKTRDGLLLKLRPTPDIAKTLCADKKSGQVAIGFALQTSNGQAKARAKLREKHLNGIVLNTPTTLGADCGYFSFLADGAEDFIQWGYISKIDCAKRIFDAVDSLLGVF